MSVVRQLERRVALFGGAFDPPHNGHLIVLSCLLNSGLVDEVWVVPSGSRSDKQYAVTDEHRIQMLERMLKSEFPNEKRVVLKFDQLDGELKKPGSIQLFEHFQSTNPGAHFSIAIGAELLGELPSWIESDRLYAEVPFLVIERPDAMIPVRQPQFTTFLPNPYKVFAGISSTALRQLLREDAATAGAMPEPVRSYIRTQQLYST